MNPSSQKEARELFDAVKNGVEKIENPKVIICPPFVYLSVLAGERGKLLLGAQNVFYEEKGAFTGEVSSSQLLDLGVEYVILGHSESRKYLNETDEITNKKLQEALKAGLKPILCIGEKKGENRESVLEAQIKEGLVGVLNVKGQLSNVIVAYEPIWAIGTGKNCSVEETKKAILFVKKTVSDLYGQEITNALTVLYGGSANSQNAQDYLKEEEVGGLLVGGASLKADEFLKIIKLAK